MKRREFLTSLLAGAAAALGGESARAQSRRRKVHHATPGAGKLDRVSISSWSFHNYFDSTRPSSIPAPAEKLALLDFPEMIADRYKVHNLEFVAPHLASLEAAYIEELKSNLVRAHSRVINIPVDVKEIWNGGGLSDPDAAIRNPAIAASEKWIDIAKQLGARSVRCDPGGLNLDDPTITIESYRQLAAYGHAKGIDVLIENHGEVGAAHPEALVEIFRSVGSPFMGALPDFGNFPDNATRRRGLPLLFPYARTVCHAKGLNLDASGNETAFDFQECLKIAQAAAFKGVYSIEYEGTGDAYQGVQGVVNELLRYL